MLEQASALRSLIAMIVVAAFAGCARDSRLDDVRDSTHAVLPPDCEWILDDCDNKIGVWCPGSPILLDMEDDGFALTDIAHGVVFELHPSRPAQMAWTAPGSDDAFLVLDRNGDGVINDGTELFGDVTEQPPGSSEEPNGYAALSMFDDDDNDRIDRGDAVWTQLLLWTDGNHDGVSQAAELRLLSNTGGIRFLGLTHVRTPRVDQYGNYFRYVARVGRWPGSPVGPLSVDVFFLIGMPLDSPDAADVLAEDGSHVGESAWDGFVPESAGPEEPANFSPAKATLALRPIAPSAGCPWHSSSRWPRGTQASPTIVWYTFDATVDVAQASQIQTAINQWNAFSSANELHVQLLYAPPGIQYHLRFQVAWDVVGAGAAAGVSGDPTNLGPVFITFYPRRSSSNGYPYVDPNRAGFDTIYIKDALHEIGHTFGLVDIGSSTWSGTRSANCGAQANGRSIMNSSSCGVDNTNDIQNIQRASISECDGKAARQSFGLPPTSGC